jgi:hypothetical protein
MTERVVVCVRENDVEDRYRCDPCGWYGHVDELEDARTWSE